jgi:hypothetical protein
MRGLSVVYRVLAVLSFAQALNWAAVNNLQHAAVTATIGLACCLLAEVNYGGETCR